MFMYLMPFLVAPVVLTILCVRVERHRPALAVVTVAADGTARTRVTEHRISRHRFDALHTVRAGRLDIHLGWYGI